MEGGAWYRLHPILVHYPIVFLSCSCLAEVLLFLKRSPRWLAREAASWLLWLGVASLWAALGSGLLAEKYAPHVPLAWETLADHEVWGRWSLVFFTVLALWRFHMHRNRYEVRGILRVAHFVCGIAAMGVLGWTGHLGGRLVYDYGMGVVTEESSDASGDDGFYEEEP